MKTSLSPWLRKQLKFFGFFIGRVQRDKLIKEGLVVGKASAATMSSFYFLFAVLFAVSQLWVRLITCSLLKLLLPLRSHRALSELVASVNSISGPMPASHTTMVVRNGFTSVFHLYLFIFQICTSWCDVVLLQTTQRWDTTVSLNRIHTLHLRTKLIHTGIHSLW